MSSNPTDSKPINVIRFEQICHEMARTYAAKNSDYDNSFAETYREFGAVAGLVRITDKCNRLKALLRQGANQQVKSESVQDTLLDLANYAIMLLIETEK